MIIAIDPGKSGAVAFLNDAGKFWRVIDMPDAPILLVEELRLMAQPNRRVILEHVGAMPGQGVTSMFNFGVSFGITQGVIAALGLPMELVRPNVWKKAMGLSRDKEASRLKALQLFPEAAEVLKRKKDEGRAEALLLGLWFARRLQVQHDPQSPKAA